MEDNLVAVGLACYARRRLQLSKGPRGRRHSMSVTSIGCVTWSSRGEARNGTCVDACDVRGDLQKTSLP